MSLFLSVPCTVHFDKYSLSDMNLKEGLPHTITISFEIHFKLLSSLEYDVIKSLFTRSVFQTVFVSGTFDLLTSCVNITIEMH